MSQKMQEIQSLTFYNQWSDKQNAVGDPASIELQLCVHPITIQQILVQRLQAFLRLRGHQKRKNRRGSQEVLLSHGPV